MSSSSHQEDDENYSLHSSSHVTTDEFEENDGALSLSLTETESPTPSSASDQLNSVTVMSNGGIEENLQPNDKNSEGQVDADFQPLLANEGEFDDNINLTEDSDDEVNNPKDYKLNITDEQISYYTACFLYLLNRTQGFASIRSALDGSNKDVITFFYKSNLSNKVLAKIWSFCDANEDGFLNYAEFVVAMHFVVLHVRQEIDAKTSLPSFMRPQITPVRHLVALPNGRYTASTAKSNSVTNNDASSSSAKSLSTTTSTTTTTGDITMVDTNDVLTRMPLSKKFEDFHHVAKIKQDATHFESRKIHHKFATLRNTTMNAPEQASELRIHPMSLSDNLLNIQFSGKEAMTKFSDIPPLLIDNKPTALNGLKYWKRRPPPNPPQKTNIGNKGHGRSYSLDLRMLPQKNKPQEARIQDPTSGEQISTGEPEPTSIDECTESCIARMAREIDICTDTKKRCEILQRLNCKLERERNLLAQVKLQLELRIEEVESQIQSPDLNST